MPGGGGPPLGVAVGAGPGGTSPETGIEGGAAAAIGADTGAAAEWLLSQPASRAEPIAPPNSPSRRRRVRMRAASCAGPPSWSGAGTEVWFMIVSYPRPTQVHACAG